MSREEVKTICFYLPQYHPVPENDEWWGTGFTEWRNVTKAKPLFPGHYQPHLPSDLGFYDLRLPEARKAQADLAREFGVHGFCYYHYWFNGRRILERPFNEVLASGEPDFPFCLCWANENWTRIWDGGERNILLEQKYSEEDDLAHIRSLIPAFKDPRYIRIEGKPLFLVYRTELLPDPAKTVALWQEEAKRCGLPGLYLARVEHFVKDVNPTQIGFDAGVEFAPDSSRAGSTCFRGKVVSFLGRLGLLPDAYRTNSIYSYERAAHGMMTKPDPDYCRFSCVTPMWDNSARRSANANILIGSTPAIFKNWLYRTALKTKQRMPADKRFVFINAWNEWAEGCHLEPDQKWGKAYLEAIRSALHEADSHREETSPRQAKENTASLFRTAYWKAMKTVSDLSFLSRSVFWTLKNRVPPY